jgi:hypothetical protein
MNQTEEMDVVCIWIGRMLVGLKTDRCRAVLAKWREAQHAQDRTFRPLPRPRSATYHMSARPEASGPSGS